MEFALHEKSVRTYCYECKKVVKTKYEKYWCSKVKWFNFFCCFLCFALCPCYWVHLCSAKKLARRRHICKECKFVFFDSDKMNPHALGGAEY